MVFCGVTFGFLVKAIVQSSSIVGQKEKYVKIMKDIESFFDILKTFDDEEIPKTFKKFNGYIDVLTVLLEIMYCSTGIFSLLYPAAIKIVSGNLVLPYGFELPFIDPLSLHGYCLNFLISSLWCFLSVFGFRISDSVLHHLIDELNKIDKKHGIKEEKTTLNFDIKMKKIVEIHQKLLNFITEVEEYYKVLNFIIIGTIFIQCVASSFALIVAKWYIGALFVVVLLLQTFIYCFFGTILEVVQSNFLDKIFEINWQDISLSQKRSILFVLTPMRKTLKLTYMFGILNYETFMTVSRQHDFHICYEKYKTISIYIF